MRALPPGTLDPRSGLIMVYALCGFANFGSVAILIAGMSALMPERRDEIVPLALRAMVSGTLASGLSALHDRADDTKILSLGNSGLSLPSRLRVLLFGLFLAGCVSQTPPLGSENVTPHFVDQVLVTRDGTRLPLRRMGCG